MANYPYALALILPATDRDDGNKLAVALGRDVWPGNTFSVPLSVDGTEPATHYGALSAATDQTFIDTLNGATQGTLPDVDWSEYELTETRVTKLIGALTTAVTDSSDPQQAWADALSAAGVQRVKPEMP
jgi:hypothetical protein